MTATKNEKDHHPFDWPNDMTLLTVSKQAVGKMERPRAKSAKLPPPFARGWWRHGFHGTGGSNRRRND
jgi:hypothetical protein